MQTEVSTIQGWWD